MKGLGHFIFLHFLINLAHVRFMDRIHTQYPFVAVQYQPRCGSGSLAAYEPASKIWVDTSETSKLELSERMKAGQLKLATHAGDLLCFNTRRWVDNKFLVMNICTCKEELVPCAPRLFHAIQLVDLVEKFIMVCFTNPKRGSLQAWIYDSSIQSWRAKRVYKRKRCSIVCDLKHILHKSGCIATWRNRIWTMLRGNELLEYHFEDDTFVEHTITSSGSPADSVTWSFVVSCDSKLFVIGYKSHCGAKIIVLWEFTELDGFQEVGSLDCDWMRFEGVCSDSVRYIWVVGIAGVSTGFATYLVEFDAISRIWRQIKSPNIEPNIHRLFHVGLCCTQLPLSF